MKPKLPHVPVQTPSDEVYGEDIGNIETDPGFIGPKQAPGEYKRTLNDRIQIGKEAGAVLPPPPPPTPRQTRESIPDLGPSPLPVVSNDGPSTGGGLSPSSVASSSRTGSGASGKA